MISHSKDGYNNFGSNDGNTSSSNKSHCDFAVGSLGTREDDLYVLPTQYIPLIRLAASKQRPQYRSVLPPEEPYQRQYRTWYCGCLKMSEVQSEVVINTKYKHKARISARTRSLGTNNRILRERKSGRASHLPLQLPADRQIGR